jgi:Putative addiction module component
METLDIKINLNFKQLTSIVKQLNPSEKMKLNEAIWDERMEIPEEHQKLVLQRIKKARENPSRMLPWDKAVKMLKP